MNNKINLNQLVELFSEQSTINKNTSEDFVRSFFDLITDTLQGDDEIVKVKGFGTFKKIRVAERESINVNTGERITIGAYNKIQFQPDADLKETINQPYASFQIIDLDNVSGQTQAEETIEQPAIAPEQETPKETVDEQPALTDAAKPAEPAEPEKAKQPKQKKKHVCLTILIVVLVLLLLATGLLFYADAFDFENGFRIHFENVIDLFNQWFGNNNTPEI
ncbi:MAG: HU family DNA-binding protein [Bacteroidaceae bacterium]|nr:HU family DNA-binding protein [Bacteroidaceae bacterium]